MKTKKQYKVTAINTIGGYIGYINFEWEGHSENQAGSVGLNSYLINRYDFYVRDRQDKIVINKGRKVVDWKKLMIFKNSYIRDIKVVELNNCEASAHSESIKVEGDNKMDTKMITVEGKTKTMTKEVSVEFKGNICKGKVGNVGFVWDWAKYDLPLLKMTNEQIKKTYSKCTTAEERTAQSEFIRKVARTFIIAYRKEMLKEGTERVELNGTVPVVRKVETPAEKVPEGFTEVSETMFSWNGR